MTTYTTHIERLHAIQLYKWFPLFGEKLPDFPKGLVQITPSIMALRLHAFEKIIIQKS